jgi:hypothetical protein
MHDGGGLPEQGMEDWRRNVRAGGDLLGQNVVILGALDQLEEALLRKARTAILGNTARDLAVAAADQHIGHRFAESGSLGNSAKVILSLGVRDIDQIGFGKPRRKFEHRLGDGDVVIVGKCAQHFGRCVGQWRKPSRKLSPRLALDLVDKQREHVVEKIDLRLVVAAGAVEKECCDALQDFAALGVRAVLDDIFRFRDQRKVGAHSGYRETSRFFTLFCLPMTDYLSLNSHCYLSINGRRYLSINNPCCPPEQPLQRFEEGLYSGRPIITDTS